MSEVSEHQKDLIKVTALGHSFTIGTLYNYVESTIVPSIRLWDPDEVSQLSNIETDTKKTANVYKMAAKSHSDDDDDDQNEFFLHSMGMDDHSALSFLSKLINPSSGSAWQYVANKLSGKPVPSSDEVVVHYRYVNKKVSIDPAKQLEIICHLDRLNKSQATHVVVAITYGLEAFCHFSYKNPSVNDKKSLKKLTNHAQNFANSLSNEREQFLQDENIQDLECILYSDSKSAKNGSISNWSSLSVNKQYEACKKLLDTSASKAIPLKVRLYPLNKLLPKRTVFKMPSGQKIKKELAIRYQTMLKLWQQISMKINATIDTLKICDINDSSIMSTYYQKITDFSQVIEQFKSDFIKALAEWTLSYRRGNLREEEMFAMYENIEIKSPFSFKALKSWLSSLEQQINTFKLLAKLPAIQLLSEIPELRERIKNKSQYSFILVLHLPSLAEQLDENINEMKEYVTAFDPSQSSNWMNRTNKVKGKINYNLNSCRQTFEAGQAFSNWVKEQNKDSTTVDYIIFYNENIENDGNQPFFQLYESRTARVVYDDFTIPEAPGEVTVVENRRGIITVRWESEENTGYTFLLQYRQAECAENEPWHSVEHSTNSITISYLQSDQAYKFRVAVLTLAGRSPFSPVSEEITIDSVCPPPNFPRLRCVTEMSIDIVWDHHHDIHKNLNRLKILCYSVECWIDGSRQDSTLIQRSVTEKKIVLEPLELDTSYCIQIRAVCIDLKGSTFYSPTSPIMKIKTLREPERAAHVFRRVSQRCQSEILGIDTFQIPLKKHRDAVTPGVGHYVFGEPSYFSLVGKRRQRTILMLGATGSGKSTLINAMVNYILGIEWSDDFRFKLIDEFAEKSQAHSQTELVTTYDLYEMKGSRLNYSLTVVDTPGFGDTRGLEKDKQIMEQIRNYFKSRHGIQQLEAVCFAVPSSLPRLTPTQKYIFESILSIFGRDIQDNIRLMVTFADNARPPVLAAIKEAGIPSPLDPRTRLPLHHKFNNSIFFTPQEGDGEIDEINETYFDMAVEGFDKFFDDLSRMEAKSLTLTREVLEERKRLEALVEGLQIRTQMKLIRVDELEQIKKVLAENKDQMDASQDNEYEVLVPKSTDISGTGQFTTNCDNCKMTCHFPCRQVHDQDKHKCSVMDKASGNCMICKCHWSKHFNQKYRYEMVKEKVTRSSDAIRQQYQKAATEKLTNEELLASVENDIKEQEKQLMDLMQTTYPHIRRLDEIALRPHPFSTPAYIDLMIAAEKQEHRKGYQQRIVTLEKLRQMAEMTAKLIKDKEETQRPQPHLFTTGNQRQSLKNFKSFQYRKQ